MCMGSAPSAPPPPPPPPAPPPVLEQAAPDKANAPTQADTLNRAATGTKKYRTSLGISDSGSSTSGTGLGIAT